MRISLVGGDARMPYAAEALSLMGHEVSLSAHGNSPLSPESLSHAEAVLLPHPLTRDGATLFAPEAPLEVPLSVLFSMLPEGVPLLVGREEPLLLPLSASHSLLAYGTRESFLKRNSHITAEGAVSLLLARLSLTLSETPCLILGNGRLAVALIDLLLGLHTPVTVFARSLRPLPFDGVPLLPLGALPAELHRFPVIINTVPACILTPQLLLHAQRRALLLELSGVPQAAPMETVTEAGLLYLSAPALPGRYAPMSAGRAVAEAAADILSSP